jgi:hypothetical protein
MEYTSILQILFRHAEKLDQPTDETSDEPQPGRKTPRLFMPQTKCIVMIFHSNSTQNESIDLAAVALAAQIAHTLPG